MKYNVLITDDNKDDFLLIKQAFSDLELNAELRHLRNGQMLVNYLAELQKKDDPLPDLIVLDIHMPVMDGLKALKIIRSNTSHAKIPVFMYTMSNSIEERDKCMDIGATAFFIKAKTYEQVLTFVNNINRFVKISNNPIPFHVMND